MPRSGAALQLIWVAVTGWGGRLPICNCQHMPSAEGRIPLSAWVESEAEAVVRSRGSVVQPLHTTSQSAHSMSLMAQSPHVEEGRIFFLRGEWGEEKNVLSPPRWGTPPPLQSAAAHVASSVVDNRPTSLLSAHQWPDDATLIRVEQNQDCKAFSFDKLVFGKFSRLFGGRNTDRTKSVMAVFSSLLMLRFSCFSTSNCANRAQSI